MESSSQLSCFKNKRDFFFPTFPRAAARSPANQEPVIELVPGLVAAASVKRQTDPEWRLGECEVHPSLELCTCISFSRALKGTSDEESSCLSDPEMFSLSRMQTKRMLISSLPNCLGKEKKHRCYIRGTETVLMQFVKVILKLKKVFMRIMHTASSTLVCGGFLVLYRVAITTVKIQTEQREQHTPKHDDEVLAKSQIQAAQCHAAVPVVEIACCESAGKDASESKPTKHPLS